MFMGKSLENNVKINESKMLGRTWHVAKTHCYKHKISDIPHIFFLRLKKKPNICSKGLEGFLSSSL